jgi:hypothetical protein
MASQEGLSSMKLVSYLLSQSVSQLVGSRSERVYNGG